ncbi:MAG: tripartite tricarboxylate transporter substrate binding protein [Pigmentiphaga sp.]|uniref:Bug family tripartite tricarboxylate transporter substrate binding protein n=1 Tax=Pigmentiphaga sp. TaxID=1977564 RepID=UPI0029AE30BB|nr:tripartite tricarboxylate transporter substrate binding protein [Pigmentiphaga sp.]MDX3904086.1 tripartite tricarboxylate transporter substrate binding protein [Pigmentiphaga sp.]
MRKLVYFLAAAGSTLLVHTAALAQQEFPTRPVRIISAFSTGSGPDAMLRIVAERLSKKWGQPVVVENKPGGSGFIAASEVKRAAADGSTLFHADGLNFTAIPYMYSKMPYKVEDFAPIVPLHHSYFFIAVSAQSNWNSVGDLLAAARAKPGRVTYGSWQIGSVAHLNGAALEDTAKVKMTHVPFKDNSQLYTSVANREVDWAFATAGSAGALQKAGKLKFLALAGPERLSTHTSVPVVGEGGGPAGFEASGWVGLFAPAGTPKTTVAKINADVISVYKQPDVPPKMVDFGYMPLLITPEEAAAKVKSEGAAYARLVKEIGLTLD